MKLKIYLFLRSDGFTVISYFLCLLLATSLVPVVGSKVALVQELLLLGLLLVLIFLHRSTLLRKIDKKLVIKGFLWGLASLLVEGLIIISIILITKVSIPSQNTSGVVTAIKKYPLFIAYTILIAPMVEELVFRDSFFTICSKYLARLLKGKNKTVWINALAALITAFIFAGLHADNAVWEYVLVSLFFQWLFYHYKDIRVSMIAHITFNLSTLSLLLFF